MTTSSRIGVFFAISLAACGGELTVTDSGARDAARSDTGTPIDAAAPDAPGADAPAGDDAGPIPDGGGGGTGCAAHDYLFCEDWESATSGALPSGWSVGGGWMDSSPMVTTDVHHGGTHALRSGMARSGQHRAEHALDSLGAARGHHWGRIFYRVATPAFVPPSGTVIHNTLVGLIGTDEARVADTVMSEHGDHQFLLNIPDDTCCVGSAFDYHSFDGGWHCAEWYVDEGTDSYRFYYDGTEVTDIAYTGADGVPIESFSTIAVGLRNYQDATTPYESFFDDLAIDDTRIGCD